MEILDTLIDILETERGEAPPENLSREQKENLFRALCNIRPPKPVSEEFLKLQDEYLGAKTIERGIVDVGSLDFKNRVALWRGDITRLNADAIVNACNSALLGCFSPLHGCVDNIIHSNAGVQVRLLLDSILKGKSEPNGRARATPAYNLPSKYIFHTVGPIVRGAPTARDEKELCACYESCLQKAVEMRLESIAFCCISTGVYGYPKDKACALAVKTVRELLSKNDGLKVVFDVFTQEDEYFYERELSR